VTDLDWPDPAPAEPTEPTVTDPPAGPSRAERIQEILRLEGIAAAARLRAEAHRDALTAEARAELASGIAPTWRIADVGTITLPVGKAGPLVDNPAALLAWCQERYPTEVENITTRQIRAAFQGALLRRVLVDEDRVVDPDTGEIVPGLTWSPGGQPKALSFRIDSQVKALFAAAGDELIGAGQR
jgi:hypothetical protein